MTVAFLDVGQGDAIFVESPTGNQMLIDGGPSTVVLRELGKLMPFYDRAIDLLVVSNPDKDHFVGFLDILRSFRVSAVLEPDGKMVRILFDEYHSESWSVSAERAKEIQRTASRKAYQDNPEKFRAQSRANRARDPQKTNASSAAARARSGRGCTSPGRSRSCCSSRGR